ncbi:D-alanyl-D-alanine carboxypeptidase [Clostridium acidisoli DSM 12555]|uniref:D-alanyl-D-alanine carboxypeptidase n=1 Tax=Clostridium acidisoli DSM 12555 TaxID=1121291 RepID=A0A1W1XLS0_9CLOT|nr:D-alanyl-D-alanine carboxypeptidase [Clostridium acidisoli DSM 12555]
MKRKIISLILTLTISISISSNVFAAENSAAPNISAKAAVAIDANTGEIIYSKNLDDKVYPASTTKLLTALILTKLKKPNDILTYTPSAKLQPSASLNMDKKPILPGDKITADTALKSMLIYSANDIAEMIAGNLVNDTTSSVSDTNKKFSVLMNNEVSKLGLKNTHFETPNGLHNPDHYTTAYDMSIIGKNAFANKEILDTVKLKNYVFKTENGIQIPIENRNKLILNNLSLYDKTCIGGKTGFTNEAGNCLVAIFNRDGRTIIGVVMHSNSDSADTQSFKDMEAMINYSYSIQPTNLYSSNNNVVTKTLSYKPLVFFGPTKTIEVPLKVNKDVQYYKNDINDKEKSISINLNTKNPWDLKKNTSVGTLALNERGVTKQFDLYTTLSSSDLIKQNKLLYASTAAGVIIIIGLITLIVRKKNN